MANKPHVHAELIKAWADGAEIEYLYKDQWYPAPSNSPTWSQGIQYRIKPERVFPKSSLDNVQLYQSAFPFVSNASAATINDGVFSYLRLVADAAVKQYILDTERSK